MNVRLGREMLEGSSKADGLSRNQLPRSDVFHIPLAARLACVVFFLRYILEVSQSGEWLGKEPDPIHI